MTGSALFEAALNGDLTAVEAFLGEELAADDSGSTSFSMFAGDFIPDNRQSWVSVALLAAVQGDHLEIVRLLLRNSADVNLAIGSRNGLTALIHACQLGHANVIDALVSHPHTNVNAKKTDGQTALMNASSPRHPDPAKLCAILLAHPKLDIDARENNGATTLLIAAQNGIEPVVRLLLDHSADIWVSTRAGATPLIVAAQHGRAQIVDWLVERGADINAAMNDGATALMLAAQNGHAAVVERLLQQDSVDPDLRHRSTGATALMIAASAGQSDCVRLLIGAGADPHAQDLNGRTALDYSARWPDVLDVFRRYGAGGVT